MSKENAKSITLEDAAAQLGVSYHRAYQLLQMGRLRPLIAPKARIWIEPKSLREEIARRQANPRKPKSEVATI